MAEEIVKVIKIETAGGQQTVKGLREEIKSLRDDLLNVEKGTKEYDNILGKLIDDEKQLTDVMRAGKNEVSAATGSYNALQNEMTALRKVWKEVTDETERAKIGQRIGELNTQLKEMDSSIGNFQRNVGNYENALANVTEKYISQKSELKSLKIELEQLQPGTEAYIKAFNRAAEITHNLAEQQEMLKYASNDLGDQLSNLRGIASNMAAGFSAANAAIGLFGGESKEVQQAMLKVQQAMALVQGLQGVDGFIKRTQGLSTAIKGWIAQSKAATVQTTAQATATKAAAVATNAETVATEGATVAQKGLNAAIKANPVGLILTALALLIANWKKVVEWLGKAVGGWDKVNAAMNKFKAAAAGVANVIKKVLLVPIKEAINYVKTLGKVFGDIFKGNWKQIGSDLKEGLDNSLSIIKDGYNVAANFAEGKEREITRQTQKEIEKRAKAHAAELDDYIKDMEAKEGADWKYTEEGKRYYEDYFNSLLQMYKKDSEEYKEAQRDKWSYEREYDEKKQKAEDDAKKAAEEARKKAADAADKAKKDLEKIEQDYIKKAEKFSIGSYKDAIQSYSEFIESISAKYENSMDEEFKASLERMKKVYGDEKDEIVAFLKSLNTDFEKITYGKSIVELITRQFTTNSSVKGFLKKTGQEILDEINEGIEQGKINLDFLTNLARDKKIELELQRGFLYYNRIIADGVNYAGKEAAEEVNKQILQIFQKNIRPKVDDALAELQAEVDKKTIKFDFEIETGFDAGAWFNDEELIPIENFDKKAKELERFKEVYENTVKQIMIQRNYYQQSLDFAVGSGMFSEEEINKLQVQLDEVDNMLTQAYADYYRNQAEIRDRYFAEDIQKLQEGTDAELREYTKMYNELYTKGTEYYNYRVTQSGLLPEHEIIAAQKSYEIQRDGLQRELDLWKKYLEDVTVVGDQRVEAEKMVAELIAEIEEGEVAHTIEMNELRSQAWGEYFNMVQDYMGGIGNLFGSLADWYEADIKAKRDANKMSQEEYEKAFEKVKGIKIAEATMSMISGALGAFMQGVMSYPPPFGEILGGIGAAAALATGAAQIAQIKNQKPDGSGGNSGLSSAAATPQVQSFTPEYIENPTGDSELSNLRNSYMNQKIYVRVSDIEAAEKGTQVRVTESSF